MDASSARNEPARLCERIESLKECFRVSSLINSSLELDEVLDNIMTASRSLLRADACSLMLVDRSGELVFEVAQGPVAGKLKGGFRIKKGQGIAGRVFESGESILIRDAYADERFNQEVDRLTGYRTTSILSVPLKVQDRVIGVSQVINKLDGTSFDAEDGEMLGLLCANAAVAVDNARLHREILRKRQIEQDLAFASSIQLSFLPQRMPAFEGFAFDAYYRAALEVGGDFYDFIELDEDHLGVLIGDVSGKGVASAMFMARFTTDFRVLAMRESDPGRLVGRMSDKVCEQSCRGMFVTLLYMVLSRGSGDIVCVNAGHLPPVVWNCRGNRYERLRGSGGPPLGIVPGMSYGARTLRLLPGDCVLLATDGLIEAKDSGGARFGWSRIEDAIRSGESDVGSVRTRLSRSLAEFEQDCPQADDTTLVLVGVEER
ncbi:MAG: SpoIIE family protein phosphatase [Desulfobacteraceae bacterium]|nr:SpoIIE family protein phosphatase [Desulfobacteraceae bacterium]